ncbi:hypothetical protein IWX49DRAFT_73341 [Phyllosticta citricarpa]|uniref:Uncharacterized protein n=1 Tax=Phyllosticta paracitricarpa TaxID=2016321 RepID=A0ABR1MYV7_9PEZI
MTSSLYSGRLQVTNGTLHPHDERPPRRHHSNQRTHPPSHQLPKQLTGPSSHQPDNPSAGRPAACSLSQHRSVCHCHPHHAPTSLPAMINQADPSSRAGLIFSASLSARSHVAGRRVCAAGPSFVYFWFLLVGVGCPLLLLMIDGVGVRVHV